jgi:chromate transport protein ChrA
MDDVFLKTIYYGGIVATLLLATVSYLLLRESFTEIIRTLSRVRLGAVFRRALYPTLVFVALAGFFSVSIRGCSGRSYTEIASDHAYILEKSQEQFYYVLIFLAIALLTWAILVAIAMSTSGSEKGKRGA